jgi:hypothetical protein
MSIECGINGDQAYSDKLTDIYSAGLSRLANQLVNGQITVDQWHQQMKDAVDRMYAFQAMAGVDGNQADVNAEAVRKAIAEQYKYLDSFADAIEQAIANDTSLGFVANRATLYAKSSQAEYWRQAVGVELPHVPKDSSTACKSNCTCSISVDCERDSSGKVVAVLATWNLDPTRDEAHCPDCPERAAKWNPLRIPVRQAEAA